MPDAALPTHLSRAADAIRTGDLDTAKTQLDEVEAIYDELEARERVKQRRSIVGRDSTATDPEIRETLDEFAQAVNVSDLRRASLLTALSIYLTDPTQSDAETIASKVDSQASQEATLVDLEATADDALDAIELPPTLVVSDASIPTGVQPKGSTFDLSVTVKNAGDEPTNDVSLATDSSAEITPDSTTIGTMPVGGVDESTFTVDGAMAGDFEVTVTATGTPETTSQATERFRVVAKSSAIDRARESLTDLVTRIEESSSVEGGRESAALAKLEAALGKLDDASKFADRRKAKQANNMLDTASQILGAFLNAVDAWTAGSASKGNGNGKGPDRPTQEFVRAVTGHAGGVIDQIALARRADI